MNLNINEINKLANDPQAIQHKLGQTAYKSTMDKLELAPVPLDRQKLFGAEKNGYGIIDRLENATKTDGIENRMREAVQQYKNKIKFQKKIGAIAKDEKVVVHAFDENGNLEVERI